MDYMFVYRNIVVGGCELLIEKLGREILKNTKNNVIVYYESIDEVMYSRFCNNNFYLKKAKEKFYDSKFENINIITFTLKDYIFFSSNKYKKIKTVLYVVHPYIFYIADKRNIILKIFAKILLKDFLLKSIQNKHIFFMDKETVQTNIEYFSMKNILRNTTIINLPIDSAIINKDILERRAKNKNNISILSIARAEFPFKGYLIGLIDFLSKYEKNDIKLTIISYGKDFKILKQKIDLLPNHIKRKIFLYGKTDYDKLEKYFNNSNLYIGMGTTVLDAAERGIITIPIKPYTYNLIADKFFHDIFLNNTNCNNSANTNNITFEDLFNKFIFLSEDDYLDLSYKNIKIVNENFCTTIISKKIEENFQNISFNNIDIKAKAFIFFYKLMNKIYYKE